MTDKIGIIGCGFIGRAWAMVFARAGFGVSVWDGAAGAVENSLKMIDDGLADLAQHGLVDDPKAARARIAPAATLEDAVTGAVYVQENVVERLEDKVAVFARMDAAARPDAILASSTSAIKCSLFTEHLKGRQRCLVVHPVNPPHLVPLVELSAAPWTSADTMTRTRALQERAGQVPITVLKEVDGFILNRLQTALLNEAFRLIEGGYVTPDDLDKTVRDGLGLRWSFMGPVETGDLNAPGGIADYLTRYGTIFQRIDQEIRAARPWSERVIPTLDAARRADFPLDRHPARQIWRDRRLAALVAHKRAQAKLPKP